MGSGLNKLFGGMDETSESEEEENFSDEYATDSDFEDNKESKRLSLKML